MNWDRAKTMLIICLLGLNVFLAAVYLAYDDRYVTTAEDLSVVAGILAANGITLYPSYANAPRRHAPVDQIVLRPASYNTGQLLEAFFTDSSNISQTFEFGNTIFTSPEGTLTIMRHIVRFEPSIDSFLQYRMPSFESFISDHPALFPNFEFDNLHTNSAGDMIYEFRQNYMGYIILANKLSFTFDKYGLTEVIYIYYPPDEFVGVLQPIISAPQALFMFKLGNAHIHEPINITRVDLVQNLTFAADGSQRIITVPYYRIFNDLSEPMLINAITGDIE